MASLAGLEARLQSMRVANSPKTPKVDFSITPTDTQKSEFVAEFNLSVDQLNSIMDLDSNSATLSLVDTGIALSRVREENSLRFEDLTREQQMQVAELFGRMEALAAELIGKTILEYNELVNNGYGAAMDRLTSELNSLFPNQSIIISSQASEDGSSNQGSIALDAATWYRAIVETRTESQAGGDVGETIETLVRYIGGFTVGALMEPQQTASTRGGGEYPIADVLGIMERVIGEKIKVPPVEEILEEGASSE